MGGYRQAQFLGYAIATAPLQLADIGDDSGGVEYIVGRYTGIEPPAADIDARIALLLRAASQARSSDAIDHAADTLKIFVVPECSLRGRQGVYYEVDGFDAFGYFRHQFAAAVRAAEWRDWLFVIGTLIHADQPVTDLREARLRETIAMALAGAWELADASGKKPLEDAVMAMLEAFTKYTESDPLTEVTNRCYVIRGGAPDPTYPEGLSVQKKYLSPTDFLLDFYGPPRTSLTEEEVAYPPIGERRGEDKRQAFDDYSIFTLGGVKFGIEICLDHSARRLRKNRKPADELVQIQIVPSCGMQIMQHSIVACAGGLVFNADGQYADIEPRYPPDKADSIWISGDHAHSQLTRVRVACHDRRSAIVDKPAARVTEVHVDAPHMAKALFAYGAGAVHVYTPLEIPALPQAT